MRTRPPRSGPARDRTGGAGPARWLLAEAAVAVGAACVALHVVTAVAGRDDGWTRVLLLVMAAACVPCIRRLRRAPTRRAWAMTGGMYAAMLAAHLALGASPSAPMAMGHSTGGPLTWTGLAMWGGLALAAVQLGLASVALAARLEETPPAAPEPVAAGRTPV